MNQEKSAVAENLPNESRHDGIARLYCDTRLGGKPRYVFTDKPECLMQVPDETRKCVVFLGYKNADGIYELAGTGFFLGRFPEDDNVVSMPITGWGFTYLLTAKHVIDGIRDNFKDKVYIRANFVDGQARWLESDINNWLFHPTESDSVDVAVLRCQIPKELDHVTIPASTIATETVINETSISNGDEVFLMGLFANHHGTHKNIPLVRVGNIAAMPEEPVEVLRFGLMDAYLIEARSLGGLSGAPVFVHIQAARASHLVPHLQFQPIGTVFFLLGLMHGHWDEMLREDGIITEDSQKVQRVNMGIAIVVPAAKILEVLEQPVIRKKEEEEIKERRKASLPTADSLTEDEGLTHGDFQDALKQASRKLPSQPDEEKKET